MSRIDSRGLSRGIIRAVLGCLVAAAPATLAGAATPRVGETAADFEREALDGAKVRLSEVARKGPVVLVVLRGFPGYQCPVCTAQVGELMGKAKQIQAAGASVVLVYPGPAEGLKAHAGEFVRGKTLPENFHL